MILALNLGESLEDEFLFSRIFESFQKGEAITIVDKDTNQLFRVEAIESWDPDCLFYYCEVKNIATPEDEEELDDFFWEILPDAIEWAMREDGYDAYIYVPPETSGVAYGVTIWLRKIKSKIDSKLDHASSPYPP